VGLLEYVTSVNIACGGHVGTTESIAETVAMAADREAANLTLTLTLKP